MKIVENAPAKLNLALHVRSRRPDGYHDLETLFVFARDGDVVSIAPAPISSFDVVGPFAPVLEKGADNLVMRALFAFSDAFRSTQSFAVTLDKRLPVASGIGGGSADAAATLRALARWSGVAADDPRLMAVAGELGADVPACLLSRACFGSGRGDVLRTIAGLGDVPALLVNPGVAVPTSAVFARWDGQDRGAIAQDGETLARGILGRNDLQPAAEALAPDIAAVIALLETLPGVRLARMSGSGATCFALFDDVSQRDAAAQVVAHACPHWWQLCTIVT